MYQISLISSTAGVNFWSRHSTDSIYKNASTGPVVSERNGFLLVKKEGAGPKNISAMVFGAIFWRSVLPKLISFRALNPPKSRLALRLFQEALRTPQRALWHSPDQYGFALDVYIGNYRYRPLVVMIGACFDQNLAFNAPKSVHPSNDSGRVRESLSSFDGLLFYVIGPIRIIMIKYTYLSYISGNILIRIRPNTV